MANLRNILTVIGVMVLCVMSSYAYRLVDSEDFQSYTAWVDGSNKTNFFGQAGVNWNCTQTVAYPECITSAAGGLAGLYNWSIQKSGANKYMNLYAIDANCNVPHKFAYTQLRWYPDNPTNFSYLTQTTDFILAYDFRFNLQSPSDLSSPACGGNIQVFHAVVDEGTAIGAGLFIEQGLGGTNVWGYNSAMYHLFRPYIDSAPNQKPDNSSCNVSDGLWHHISTIFRVNASEYIINWTTYDNGVACYSAAPNYHILASSMFTSPLDIRVVGVFAIDIDNLSIWEANATENFTDLPLGSFSCSDGIDNDGDGFIDYPADHSCSGYTDNTETPFDTTQCNNGVDDDADGFVDIDDPRCGGTITGLSEFPSDATVQPDTPCLSEEFCLLYEKFPYSDNITLHGWGGQVSRFKPLSLLGSYRLYFDNAGTNDFWLYKNLTNTNIYNSVQVWFELSMATKDTWSGSDSSIFYVELKDAGNKTLNYLKFNLTQIDPLSTRCQIYITNGTSETLLATIFPSLSSSGNVRFKLTIDQVTKQYQVAYGVGSEWNEYSTYFGFYDPTALKVQSFVIRDPFDSSKFNVYIDNINILGADTNFDTTCDEVSLPYYLKESFNGYLAVCGWSSSHNMWFRGVQVLSDTTGFYYAQKTFTSPLDQSPLGDATSRYFTLSFDFALVNSTTTGNWEVRLFDNTNYNFFVIYNNGNDILYNDANVGKNVVQDVPLSTSYPYKIVFDFQADTYNIYFNGSKVVTAARFINELYNLENANNVKISNSHTGFKLDNLAIYTSDALGNAILPSTNPITIVTNSTLMCGVFSKVKPTCTQDTDCTTGDCMPNGRCNSFDMTYCDKHGYVRGNKCILVGVASCFFGSATDVVFDNFFYVLIAIIMLIAIVYLSVMLRRR